VDMPITVAVCALMLANTHDSFRQASFPISLNEMVEKTSILERLCCGPIADPEYRIGEYKHLGFSPRFINAPQLRQACRKEAPGMGAISRLMAQRLNRRLILPKSFSPC